LGGFGAPRSIFGARLRTRWPQYGHSVTYGETSEAQFLQTTKRSGSLTYNEDTRAGKARKPLWHRRWCIIRGVRVDVNGLGLEVAESGPADGPLVLLLHGFPELGFSWRHQVPALAAAGYRVMVPDMRGFGGSDAPEAVEAYSMSSLTKDVVGLIEHAGESQAIVIGHDWGADVAWKTAWMHPERVKAVGGLSVPFVPRAPAQPIPIMRRHLGEGFYIVWFQQQGPPEAALAKDVRRTLSTKRQWDPAWAENADENPSTPSFMTDEELQVYVDAYERTGFRGGLNYYRNIDRSWAETAPFADRRIEQPAFFLTGSRDPVTKFMPAAAMDGWVTDLRVSLQIEGAGHWVNQERPDEVNAALLDWLAEL
jgi:pimeloyl-ACP methyl ester carboxylesterase